jgi:SAM-dependent methyltransferase
MVLAKVLRAVRRWKPDDRNSKARWDAGLSEEIAFWDSYLGSQGLLWPKDYQKRLDPRTEFSSELDLYLLDVTGTTVRILDVGAGPLTRLGKTHPTRRLEIIATDPLAPHYDRLLEKHGIVPPVRTISGAGEELTKQFPRNSFDFAMASNCLDHSYNPLRAIEQMIAVVKPSRYIFLTHSENEAEKQSWHGLHQWNFTVIDGDFVVRNRNTNINVTREVRPEATVECRAVRNGWIDVVIHKHPA